MALNEPTPFCYQPPVVSHNLYTIATRGWSQVRKLGLRLLWLRYVRRRAILRTPAVPCSADGQFEVHTQICERDGLNLLWTLKSFAFHARVPFRLVVFCDGSVTPELSDTIHHHFPGVTISRVTETPDATTVLLATRPTMAKMRLDPRFITLPKVTDSYTARERDVVLMIDPDVLFFAPPQELIAEYDSSRGYFGKYNMPATSDFPHNYCFDTAEFERLFELSLPRFFNAGLGSVNYRMMDWDLIENAATRVPFDPALGLMADQTMAGITCAARGLRELPVSSYAIQPVQSLQGVVARHYFSKTRDLLYVEGIPELIRQGLLKNNFRFSAEPAISAG
jgi:hypothetical protein